MPIKLYIADWRKYHGLSQDDLAKAIGTDATIVSRKERSEAWDSIDLERFSKALKIDPIELLGPPPSLKS